MNMSKSFILIPMQQFLNNNWLQQHVPNIPIIKGNLESLGIMLISYKDIAKTNGKSLRGLFVFTKTVLVGKIGYELIFFIIKNILKNRTDLILEGQGNCWGKFSKNIRWVFFKSRAGNSLICSFAHRSFAHSLIAHLLIRSFRSNQMSDCERFTQIAQDKWVIVRELLRSLRGNEQPWGTRSGRSEEMSEWVIRSKILAKKI